VSDSNKKPKARLTAKGNVKVTLTQREAKLIVGLIGCTVGGLGYSLYEALKDIVGEVSTFDHAIDMARIDTDCTPE
jgi:hypothetical protein